MDVGVLDGWTRVGCICLGRIQTLCFFGRKELVFGSKRSPAGSKVEKLESVRKFVKVIYKASFGLGLRPRRVLAWEIMTTKRVLA